MKETFQVTEQKITFQLTKENGQIQKPKKLKSRKLFVDNNEIENQKNIRKYEDEENLAFDSKYSSKIKQEEEKIEKAKSSTSTSSQNDNINDNINNEHLTPISYSKYPYPNIFDRKLSSPICYYYDGSDKYLSEINSSLVDFTKSNNYIEKETYFNNDYFKNYVNKFRPRSFGNINELNFNKNEIYKNYNNTNNNNDTNNNNTNNNDNPNNNQNFSKYNFPFNNYKKFNYESKLNII
jgi:hypothetical protein